MISPVTGSTAAAPVAQAAAIAAPPAVKPPASTADTVQVSNAAKALLQESLETSAQTTKEAGAGDPQAIRLLARHAPPKAHAK